MVLEPPTPLLVPIINSWDPWRPQSKMLRGVLLFPKSVKKKDVSLTLIVTKMPLRSPCLIFSFYYYLHYYIDGYSAHWLDWFQLLHTTNSKPRWNAAPAHNLIWVGRVRKNTQHRHISQGGLGDRKQIKSRKYSSRIARVRQRKGGGRVRSHIYDSIINRAHWCVSHPKYLVPQIW